MDLRCQFKVYGIKNRVMYICFFVGNRSVNYFSGVSLKFMV